VQTAIQKYLHSAYGAEVRLWALQTAARDQHRAVTRIIDWQLHSSQVTPHRSQVSGDHNSKPIITRRGAVWRNTQPYAFVVVSFHSRNTRHSCLCTYFKSCDFKVKLCIWRRWLFWSTIIQLCRFMNCCGSFWEYCCPFLQPKTASHSFPTRCSHLFHAVYCHWTALNIEVVSVTETSATIWSTRWRRGWGTALQTGRSLDRFPLVSLEFFIDIILPASLCSWGRLSL
jgi:hypothetical protein